MQKNIAIVGATGIVGKTLLELFWQKQIPAKHILAFASHRSAGKKIPYGTETLEVKDIVAADFTQAQCAFFAAGSEVAAKYAPQAVAAGCWVIDKSSYYRLHENVPLMVPEVNGHLFKDLKQACIIATPNCSTTQLVMALNPIYQRVGLKRVFVATYQAVSGAGQAAVDELLTQVASDQIQNKTLFDAPIALNIIPRIDDFLTNDYTKEEMKLQQESRKILAAPHLVIDATAVRVPVLRGHCEAVCIETEKAIELSEAQQILAAETSVKLKEARTIITPRVDAANNCEVLISRLRRLNENDKHHLSFWVISDNLLRGAAYNALRIAEYLELI